MLSGEKSSLGMELNLDFQDSLSQANYQLYIPTLPPYHQSHGGAPPSALGFAWPWAEYTSEEN